MYKFSNSSKFFDIKNNFKLISGDNYFLLKYYSYFNKIFFFKDNTTKINQLNFYGLIGKNNSRFYYFNNYNFFFFKKVFNVLIEITKNNYNYLILNSSYKNILPLYNYIFNFNNLLTYKKYFFLNSNFFSFNN